MPRIPSVLGPLFGALSSLACGAGPEPEPEAPRPVIELAQLPYPKLSDYGFFVGDMVKGDPAPGVLPYTVAAPLWADAAGKGRYLFLPEGETLELNDREEWVLPLGSVVIKSFFVDLDRSAPETNLKTIETRLLVHGEEGWHSYIYRWNEEQTEATRLKAGADVYQPYVDAQGQPAEQIYIIPDENTCGNCHERDDVLGVLGLTTAQMNVEIDPPWGEGAGGGERVSQLEWLADQGVIEGLPDPSTLDAFADPAGDASLDARARAYLHGNCAHCHRPGAGGGASGLKFSAWETDPAQYGECKVPAAAGPGAGGRSFDIVPGHPELSIVVHRMASTDPEIKMPELPSLLADDFGVDLITEWIAAMPERDCNAG